MKEDLTEKVQKLRDNAKQTLKETGDKIRQKSEKAKDAGERKVDRVEQEAEKSKDDKPNRDEELPPTNIYY